MQFLRRQRLASAGCNARERRLRQPGSRNGPGGRGTRQPGCALARRASTSPWQGARRAPAAERLAGELGQRVDEFGLLEQPRLVACDDVVAGAVAPDDERVAPFRGPPDVDGRACSALRARGPSFSSFLRRLPDSACRPRRERQRTRHVQACRRSAQPMNVARRMRLAPGTLRARAPRRRRPRIVIPRDRHLQRRCATANMRSYVSIKGRPGSRLRRALESGNLASATGRGAPGSGFVPHDVAPVRRPRD